jgi:glycosyltransferase involved in cell wall biosynthesis
VKALVRDLGVRAILRRAAAVLVPGAASRRYMMWYGVRPDIIFEGYYTFDAAVIKEEVDRQRMNRGGIRERMEIPEEAFVYLMVANLTPRRQHLGLLEAFRRREVSQNSYLILVGSGSEEGKLREFCARHGLNNVRFLGNVGFDELPTYYAASDAYVHTGQEPYSTALMYGAIAGLPVISSVEVGGVEDLTIGEVTPFLVNRNDCQALVDILLKVRADRALGERVGNELQRLSIARSVEWAAEQFERAVDVAVGGCER